MGLRDRLGQLYERWDTWAENHRLPKWLLWLLGRLGLPAFLATGLYVAARHDWFEDENESGGESGGKSEGEGAPEQSTGSGKAESTTKSTDAE